MKKLLAAIGFFTRIPVWRVCAIPDALYQRVVDLWPWAGWATGGISALALWGALQIMPPYLAVMMAFSVRLLITGALHEDGFADFIDGFGGGGNRARILAIMKDSHIGSYGVIGLIVYFFMLVSAVASLPATIAPIIVFAADPFGKFCGSFLINTLPYARKREEAKNKLIYDRMTPGVFITCMIGGIAPLALIPILHIPLTYLTSTILPVIFTALLIPYLRRKIGGYTGDCCGFVALTAELAFYLSASVITTILANH